ENERIHMFGGDCRVDDFPGLGRTYVEKHHLAHTPMSKVRQRLTRRETELIEVHTVLVAMTAFERICPLDEGLLCNAEHGDLCLLVRQAGGKVFLEPRSQITYVPPKRVTGADLAYFRLRWSEAWGMANTRHLREKWNLVPHDPAMEQARKWVAHHRRYCLTWLGTLRKFIGRKPAAWVEKKIVAHFETAANLRQYPPEQYGAAPEANVKVVYMPEVSAAALRAA